MMVAALEGAMAFQKGLGACHALAHALTPISNVHHGLANALMIDTVLDWNREVVPEKFAELSHAVDIELDSDGGAFIRWLRALKERIGICGGLAARGVTRAHLPLLVPLAAKDFTALTNPRPTVEADYERFFIAAM